MTQANQSEYFRAYAEGPFAETPFVEPRQESLESEEREEGTRGENESRAAARDATSWTFDTPFETSESAESGEAEVAPEVTALAEITAELKDHLFREALESLATEALDAHEAQLAAEYGDHEQREGSAERLLADHFAPVAAQLEATLDRFFERLESYEASALTEAEIDRTVNEIAPFAGPGAPATEQFIGRFIRKAGRLASGAVRAARHGVKGAIKLAGKGLAAVGKLTLGPLLKGLKLLGSFVLKQVVKYALNQLPPALQPLGQKLADKLFHAVGVHESEDHEQTEGEGAPAGPDVGRLEAEFDLGAAQLLLAADETEMEAALEQYGAYEAADRSLNELDDARAGFVRELQKLEAGESPQPLMEQFLPALLWPTAKTALAILGRKKVVGMVGKIVTGLIGRMIGAQPAAMLGPAIADAGLRLFGLETEGAAADPRALTAEALAATVEETINRVAESPLATLENETLLEVAVREAFEDAAATYFPSSHIKPELRETEDGRGVWMRMPQETSRKRYAKYSERVPVTITPRVAESVHTFGHARLSDHLRDRMDAHPHHPVKTHVRVFQVLPGATTSSIARAERIHPRDLHPLTPHAAGALLGPHAGLGAKTHPAGPPGTPHDLRLRQRLYYVEPPGGRKHHHARRHAHGARTEVSINLAKGEIKLWVYLSEPLTQKIAAELAKSKSASGAHRLVHPLVHRAAELLKSAAIGHHLPPALRIIGEKPNLEHRTPPWLAHVGATLGVKIAGWASHHVAQYLRNSAEHFRKLSASEHDGITLRITMTRVPGIEVLRHLERGQHPKPPKPGWLHGEPAFEIVATPGHTIR